jgi:palmitoyltransferase ZDHHC9/14/18
LLTSRDGLNFKQALGEGAGSAVAFSLSIVVIWPIGALALYHIRLLLLNVTTIEQVGFSVYFWRMEIKWMS